tara:strand:- start:8596 stop:8859 length:264 start_codon:yes stop_codon:yes gene_type:complete
MSKQLTEEEAIQLIRSNPSARNRYNWDKWMDGEWHHVFRSVDYSCTDTSFRNLLYLKVKKFGKIKAIKLEDGFLIKKEGHNGTSEQQ